VSKTDLKYLITTTNNNPDIILELIDIFIEQIAEFNNDFNELYELGNYDAIGKLAHKAKSSVAIMGMEILSSKLKELEILARENKNPETYPSYISYFKDECAEAAIELIDYKKNLQH
jgi:HPt (histidine-containing phosphotransfer) domain-containing protein